MEMLLEVLREFGFEELRVRRGVANTGAGDSVYEEDNQYIYSTLTREVDTNGRPHRRVGHSLDILGFISGPRASWYVTLDLSQCPRSGFLNKGG